MSAFGRQACQNGHLYGKTEQTGDLQKLIRNKGIGIRSPNRRYLNYRKVDHYGNVLNYLCNN